MAVDTDAKKLSLINYGVPWYPTLFPEDGSVDVGDKLHVLNLYSGITPSAPVIPTLIAAGCVSATDVFTSSPLTATASQASVPGITKSKGGC